MKNGIRYLIAFTLCTGIAFQACKKEFNQSTKGNQKTTIDPNLVFRKPETLAEKNLVMNLEKITDIIKEVYKNKEALKEANAAIFAKIYSDESVMLRDLIFPENGVLNNSKSFQKLKSDLSLVQRTFSASFWKGVQMKNDPELNMFLNQLNDGGMTLKKKDSPHISTWEPIDVTLYFPYSYEFINPYDNSGNYSPETSVMTATADADEGYGWKTIYDSYGNMGYTKVVINDDYAFANPTHIIGINGVEPIYYEPNNTVSTFPPGPPIQMPTLTREVSQVFIGEVRCRKQYDKLISFSANGGGSEIRFTRADGFLKQADGQVQSAEVFVINGLDKIGRWHIRNEKWVDWTISWDADWESDNTEQNLAIYEEDNRNPQTLNLSVVTKVKINGQDQSGTIGGALNFKSDDQIIRQQNHKWDVFFPLNRGIPGDPSLNGWLIYDDNSPVSFTLPDRKLIP